MENSKNSLENIMKIIKLIFEKMQMEEGTNFMELADPDELLKRGFQPEDIDLALRCLGILSSQKKTENDTAVEKRSNAIRHFHQTESIRLTTEAQQMLFSLVNSNQITPPHFEKIIEYLWLNDMRDVSLNKLQLILDMSSPTPPSQMGFYWNAEIPKPISLN